jgi:ribosomal-protein-serine acetyltransferase
MTEIQHREFPYETLPIDGELVLRALRLDEAGVLFSIVDANRTYLAKFLQWANETTSSQDSLAFIEQIKENRINGQEYGYGIVLEGHVVGHITLMHLKDGETPEIGYWIAEEASGRSVTKKATEAVTRFGFEELGLDEIVIRARKDNGASNGIAQSLGYRPDGEHISTDGSLHNRWIMKKPVQTEV